MPENKIINYQRYDNKVQVVNRVEVMEGKTDNNKEEQNENQTGYQGCPQRNLMRRRIF